MVRIVKRMYSIALNSCDFILVWTTSLDTSPMRFIYTSKEPVCPRVELILKIIIILLILFLGFIKSKPC